MAFQLQPCSVLYEPWLARKGLSSTGCTPARRSLASSQTSGAYKRADALLFVMAGGVPGLFSRHPAFDKSS
jgi:hypothetical protein